MDGLCPFAEQITGVTSFQSGYVDRVGFCDHTAGGFVSTLRNPGFYNGAGVSTHFAIGRDGSILQFVNILDTAWAQGALGPVQTWPPYATMGKRNPNGYLISTEHEDHEMVNGVSTAIPGSQWTPAQYASDLKLKRWCVDEVKRVANLDMLRFGIDSLAGHHMFDGVNRAECPGKFWRDVYHAQLYADLVQPQEANNVAQEHYPEELNQRRARELLIFLMNQVPPQVHVGFGAKGLTVTGSDGAMADVAASVPDWAAPN